MGAEAVEVTLLDRQLSADEVRYVSTAIYNHMAEMGVKGHPLAPFLSFENVHRTCEIANRSGYLDVYVLGDRIIGVIMYDFGNLWWADEACLKEMIILTIDPDFVGFGRIALERLEELAVEHDCALIETGSAMHLDKKLIENMYVKKGRYQITYPTFVRIVG
jgi:hypothetical protein